jgi:hypothetical protein
MEHRTGIRPSLGNKPAETPPDAASPRRSSWLVPEEDYACQGGSKGSNLGRPRPARPEELPFAAAIGAVDFLEADMERVVKKSKSFSEAEAWDREQYRAMSPAERMRAARELKLRVYHGKRPDVRECHIGRRTR